ncbi:MAG TPA: zeta toxin family protein, partial [Patescibacteria group bacterium]|nr:zeta toxin family protein [Patescibacteria group bacterium]
VDLSLALKDIEPTIYIVRGNIATGKTTALRNHPHFARIRNNLDGIISPDDYKVIFHREKVGDNKSVKDDQIHQESLFLAREIQDQIINFGENRTSLVIDKRFAWEEEITSILLLAMNTSRDIDITDIDCPLELSVIRVLSRYFPRPKLNTFLDGFERIRKYRRNLIERAETIQNISYYILLDTSSGQKMGPDYRTIAEIRDNKPPVIRDRDEKIFKELAPNVPLEKIEFEIKKGVDRDKILLDSYLIDNGYIQRVREKFFLSVKEIEALLNYKNLTLLEAINKHLGEGTQT